MQRIPRHLSAGVIVVTAGGVTAATTIGQLDRSDAAPVPPPVTVTVTTPPTQASPPPA